MILLKIAFISLFPIVLCEKVKRQEQVIHEIPKFKRGPIVIVDETALTNPNSFDYDFSDDLGNTADKQDLYDQFIDQLPMFHIYKLGTDRGVTQVPIVTRAGQDTWFTPSTASNREQKFTFYLTTPMTPKKKTTTTTHAPLTTKMRESTPATHSTTERAVITTTVPTTTTTEKTKLLSTTPTSTTTRTVQATTRINRIRRPFPKQPRPVFKVHISSTTTTTTTSAPETPTINRGPIWRKGGVIIDTTTSPRPLTTPRQWTIRGIRIRVTRPPASTTTTPTPTTTTQSPNTRAQWWKTTTSASRWVAGPRHPPRFNQNQNWKHPIRKLQETISQTAAPPRVDPVSNSQPKPVVIHTGRYSGPTYNCRVLNPFTDGQASSEHDSSCKMLYPGLSLDGTCRCFYKVAGRDEHGCATGFIYACRALGLRSISV
ncbi:Clip domain-containing protein [Caenorhabditis elegans]|uniref:Clip domain-containing protein n=1 Tax=Caenorhabditis elegans TaxID=6239 RepID=Q19568_CAEEL|nr:Clip domain-containing protein [Caenorhabditis elegans]CCD68431.1 Clip domain-containing protein [Caenorhabditis elegans]|eukprot:NP_509455.3 Uncharacterized protein CELE_F18E9.3 [Caenorhabditis elegans]